MTVHEQPAAHDDHDSPWKEALEHYFPDFLALLFPNVHALVDWERGFAFLDKELQKVVGDAELGRRYADKLVRVHTREGSERWILIHVEVQGQAEAEFAERMYVYYYRLFDRYRVDVISLAVLADDALSFRPQSYRRECGGCELEFRFPTHKLLDWVAQWPELESSDNRFALVVMAHLRALSSRDGLERKRWKMALMRLMYERHYSRDDILKLFRVIDWIIRLPAVLAEQFSRELYEYEEAKKMPYVTSIEQIGIAKGVQQGLQQGMQQGMQQGRQEGRQEGRLAGEAAVLARQLRSRFGPLAPPIDDRLQHASLEQLESWADRILDARSIGEVFGES